MVDGVGVCTVCAKVCHKDHEISYAKYGSFFCDCGAKEDGNPCNEDYLAVCGLKVRKPASSKI
uniref:UBR-type domain-containing protein n=1 Tax=Acanthochromis polyacanthus TaxID=80966 RepID=A0A3Q1FI58_9TELE